MNHPDEPADGGTTYYLSIPDAAGANHDTALFIPAKFNTNPRMQLLLYFHGHTEGRNDLWSFMHRPVTPLPLRQIVGGDGRFAFAMPWIGTLSQSFNHITGSALAFDTYVASILQEVWARTRPIGPPAPGSEEVASPPHPQIVLGAHSGGGNALSTCVDSGVLPATSMRSVTDVWAFDCFYDFNQPAYQGPIANLWISWVNTYKSKSLTMYYTGTSTTPAQNSRRIDDATGPNATALPSEVSHDETPKRYLPDLLATIV
jgi:hypothetical protein